MANNFKGGATGSQFDDHDPLYAWAQDLHNNNPVVSGTGDPVSIPCKTLAATGTTGVETTFAIGAAWRAVAMRWGWVKDAVGTGNVVFRVRYGLIYPLLSGSGTAISLTTISVPAEAVAGNAAALIKYSIPTVTADIPTPPDGFLGSAPLMHLALERLADDAGDTYGGSIGVFVVTLTRVD